jgi:hypothetical protein
MNRLCKEDEEDMRNIGFPAVLTIEQIWKDNLGRYKQADVAPLAIDYFQNVKGYITQKRDGRISLTETGRLHCRDPETAFTLPEHNQSKRK